MKKIMFFAAFACIVFGSCEKSVQSVGSNQSGQARSDQAQSDLKYNTFSGPQIKMGAGKARSRINISHAGTPIEIGVEMTDEVLSQLPDTNFTVNIPMHKKALETTPFDHLSITWASHGHPLPGTFIGPHFDVRFFMTSLDEQLAIPPPPSAGFDNLPPPGYMPESYFPDAAIPKLGLHWTDKTFPDPVTEALILGSYDGKFTFVSPIITLPVLLSGERLSIPYAQPQQFAVHSWFPTKYNVYMDESTGKHYVTLSDFVLR